MRWQVADTLERRSTVADILTAVICWQVADTLGRRSTVVAILTDAVRAYQAVDVMETQGEVYLKNLNQLSDTLHDLKGRHEGKLCPLRAQMLMHYHASCDSPKWPLLCAAVHDSGPP